MTGFATIRSRMLVPREEVADRVVLREGVPGPFSAGYHAPSNQDHRVYPELPGAIRDVLSRQAEALWEMLTSTRAARYRSSAETGGSCGLINGR